MVGGNEETDDGDTANVEKEDTDIDTLDRLGEVATGVLRLTSSNLEAEHSARVQQVAGNKYVRQQSRYR